MDEGKGGTDESHIRETTIIAIHLTDTIGSGKIKKQQQPKKRHRCPVGKKKKEEPQRVQKIN